MMNLPRKIFRVLAWQVPIRRTPPLPPENHLPHSASMIAAEKPEIVLFEMAALELVAPLLPVSARLTR